MNPRTCGGNGHVAACEDCGTRGTRRLFRRGGGCLLLLQFALISIAAAQARPPTLTQAPEAAFGEALDVRIVNVEVVVEDERGNRVKGLAAADFRLLVDRVEVPIDHFAEVAGGRAASMPDAAAPDSARDGGAIVTNYLIFVDDDHTIQSRRRPVMDGLAKALDSLAPGDRVAVVVKCLGRLELLSPYTADRTKSRLALDELARGKRFRGAVKKRWFLGSYPPEAGTVPYRGGLYNDVLERLIPNSFEEEARAAWLQRLLGLSASSVSSAMRALDPSSGRKVLLLIAGSWPTGDFRPAGENLALRTDRELLTEIVDTANLLGYTVYPVDQARSHPSTQLWQNLRMISRGTGGKVYSAGSNLTALDRVRQDTSDYYWLGFAPDYRHDDQAHDIRVEVRRPGLALRSRVGYVDLSPVTLRQMELQRSLLFPAASWSTASLAGRAGRPEKIGGRRMKVPLHLVLPVGAFSAMPGPNGYVQRLEVRIGAIDRLGRLASLPAVPLTLRPRTQPSSDAEFPFRTTLTLRRVPHSVVVRVADLLSGDASEARFEISPRGRR